MLSAERNPGETGGHIGPHIHATRSNTVGAALRGSPFPTICHSEERSDEESREQKCTLLSTGSFAVAQDDSIFLRAAT